MLEPVDLLGIEGVVEDGDHGAIKVGQDTLERLVEDDQSERRG